MIDYGWFDRLMLRGVLCMRMRFYEEVYDVYKGE